MNIRSLLLLCLAVPCLNAAAQRTETLLEKGWRFTHQDDSACISPGYDTQPWERVQVPHDWAITGPFSYLNDRQNVAITQDGQKEAMEHAGRTGGLPFVGVGWYRLEFDVPDFHPGRRVELIFDGAMSHPRVYINGHYAGGWEYGYNAFTIDITPYVKAQGNTLAVRLYNESEQSRWYPGAGLYRNVHLVTTDIAHIPTWGVQILTPHVTDREALVEVRTAVNLPERNEKYRLYTEITNPQGQVVATSEKSLSEIADSIVYMQMEIGEPQRWDVDSPQLYRAVSKLYEGHRLCDSVTTPFGIRTIELIAEKGFLLNGRPIKFKGVCNHDDLGPLGMAVNESALRRRIMMLKDMGANAIRTSHNMPSPELIRLCDEMGLMVMAESFDEWRTPKVANGYHKFFDAWAERDLVNLIRHFRNSPSIVMWCIGNEVPDQYNQMQGTKITHWLQSICHREDPTRPVTMGMDAPDAVVNNNIAAVLDVPGFNYRPFKYQTNYDKLPQGLILGSETASTLSSRGVYKFPVTRGSMRKYEDHQASSYDVEHCGWSNLPEDDWIWHDEKPWAIGEFVWTGFDYLGEPTPYYSDWPSHSSLFGIIDLANIPKDRYYLYRSHWAPEKETLHVLPHWTWPGREGETTPVFVYTNYPCAEVFINGKSQGRVEKDTTLTPENTAGKEAENALQRQKRYRLMWPNTKYEPGTLRVVAYDNTGKAVAQTEIHTAGPAYRLEAEADTLPLRAGGQSLCYIRVRMVDRNGNLVPDANQLVEFSVKGAGVYKAAANGDPTCLDLFQEPQMHLFNGQLTAIVATGDKAGNFTFTAKSKGVKSAKVKCRVE